MSYSVPHTWVAGDFLRASWLNLTTTDLVDHETRIVALEASGAGDVVGPSASVDKEIALFDATTGKLLERATGTGYVKVTSGVMGTPVATVPTSDLSGNLPLANLPTNFAQIFKATVTLTDAQIKALPTTPIQLVAAQGAGTRIVIIQVDLFADCSSGAYANVNADSYLYAALTGEEVFTIAIENKTSPSRTDLSTFLGAQDSIVTLVPYTEVASSIHVAHVESASGASLNSALKLFAGNSGSGNFTGGNAANSIVANVWFTVL